MASVLVGVFINSDESLEKQAQRNNVNHSEHALDVARHGYNVEQRQPQHNGQDREYTKTYEADSFHAGLLCARQASARESVNKAAGGGVDNANTP